jgi:integrase
LNYINTRPPVSDTEIAALLKKIESVKTPIIDGIVLSNLIRTCYECGLKKGELIDLSITDVAKGGVVDDVIWIGDSEIQLSEQPQTKKILQSHIDYLKKNGYRSYPTNPLFPTRKKRRYIAKTLDNHMKEAQNV